MLTTPHRSSRVLLVASGRSAAGGAGPVVRRYRLARVRVSPAGPTVAAHIAPGKRG